MVLTLVSIHVETLFHDDDFVFAFI